MKKTKLTIEIVSSRVIELSSMNKSSRNSILNVLSQKYTDVKITLIDTQDSLDQLVARSPDLVFLGMKFIYNNSNCDLDVSNRIWISEYLDKHDICYTGSMQKPHLLEFNKDLAKITVSKAGIETADFLLIENGEESEEKFLPKFPLFIKPSDQGGGSGIDSYSLVRNIKDLNTKVKSIFNELGSNSIAESYLSGREYSVAVLKNDIKNDYLLMPLELIAPLNEVGERFLSNSIKKADTEIYCNVTDTKIFKSVTELAMDAFKALGARDYGRIDIRFDSSGVPHFIEANLIPSLLKDYGNFPKACLLNLGMNFEDMIMRIVNLALDRDLVINYDSPKVA